MNKAILMGRLTKDPDVRTTPDGKWVARYTLAVDRKFSKEDQKADFIQCVCWEKKAQFADQYLRKGTKVVVSGRIQTGKYTNKDGQTVYTTDVVVEDQEFAESKQKGAEEVKKDEFIPIDEMMQGGDLPWD